MFGVTVDSSDASGMFGGFIKLIQATLNAFKDLFHLGGHDAGFKAELFENCLPGSLPVIEDPLPTGNLLVSLLQFLLDRIETLLQGAALLRRFFGSPHQSQGRIYEGIEFFTLRSALLQAHDLEAHRFSRLAALTGELFHALPVLDDAHRGNPQRLDTRQPTSHFFRGGWCNTAFMPEFAPLLLEFPFSCLEFRVVGIELFPQSVHFIAPGCQVRKSLDAIRFSPQAICNRISLVHSFFIGVMKRQMLVVFTARRCYLFPVKPLPPQQMPAAIPVLAQAL